MAQNLDPNSDGRGVLQFKTGLMSLIKVLPKFIMLTSGLLNDNVLTCYFILISIKNLFWKIFFLALFY